MTTTNPTGTNDVHWLDIPVSLLIWRWMRRLFPKRKRSLGERLDRLTERLDELEQFQDVFECMMEDFEELEASVKRQNGLLKLLKNSLASASRCEL